jgi:hypothetical protein
MARVLPSSLAGAALAFVAAAFAEPARAQVAFTIQGPGGNIPAVGTGFTLGWPLGVPENEKFQSSATTQPPADAWQWTMLEIHGLNHTWVGDVQIVLQSPNSGPRYNILSRPGFVGNPNPDSGNRGDFIAGTFQFVESGAQQVPHILSNQPESQIPPGTYVQDFGNPVGGTWPSGTSQIYNVPLSEIPVVPGTWRLFIYDWNTGDVGSCTGWTLHGLRSPQRYCTSGTTLQGCVPEISATANPSASSGPACTISVAGVPGQRSGILFYGIDNSGWGPSVWTVGSNSYLCVKPPTQRTLLQTSNGTTGGCDGSLAINWNVFFAANPAALGTPWAAGDHAYVQGWFRDPGAPKNTNLSDAIHLVLQP